MAASRGVPPLVLALTLTIAAILPALARASTTIGQTSGTPVSCQTTGTRVWWTSGTGQPLYSVPAGGGVITSWTTNTGSGGTATRLAVFRPSSSNTLIGESAIESPIPAHNTASFPTRITAEAGDVIGLENIDDGGIWCGLPATGDGMSYATRNGPGMPIGPQVFSFPGDVRADISAVVEPDADSDGYGDETQAKADLAIAESGSSTGTAGGNLTYTITVMNDGPEAAPGVVVSDPLPSGTAFVSAGPASCDATVRCSLGTLASGASVTRTIVLKATQGGIVRNVATVGSPALDAAAAGYPGRGDTNPSNDSASVTTTVTPQPLLAANVSNATLSNRAFRGSTRPHPAAFARRRPPVGTTFKFTLDKAAPVRFDFTQAVRGRKLNGRCVAQNRRNRRKPACRRTAIRGSLGFAGHAGVNTVRFYGWLSNRRRLKPGRYTLVITATTTGVGSTSKTLTFTIVR
jgi:uncharacterized repeat protein (TIGR01451 family)